MLPRKDSNVAVDLTETIKEETVNHHQSFIDRTLCASLLDRVISHDSQGSAGLVSRPVLGQVTSIQRAQFNKLYELHYGPRYKSRYTVMHARPTTAIMAYATSGAYAHSLDVLLAD